MGQLLQGRQSRKRGRHSLAISVTALGMFISAAAQPCLAFEPERHPPALRLGQIGHDFASERQCFPADGMFQVAFNESANIHFLIARANCYLATDDADLALEGFEWAGASGAAMGSGVREFISQQIARLGDPVPAAEGGPETVQGTQAPPELRTPNGYVSASALFRTNDTIPTPVPQADLNEPHVGAEFGWHPFWRDGERADDVALFARVFGALETDGVKVDEDTLQGGVGLSLRPFGFLDLVVRGERLIPIGEDALEGWLFSGSYNWEAGNTWLTADHPWWVAHTRLDAAWIPEDPEYISASGETLFGAAIPIGERIALIPHGVAALRYSEDEFEYNALGEAGVGLTLRHWFAGNTPARTMDISLQYRWFVLEDTVFPLEEDGAWVARLILER